MKQPDSDLRVQNLKVK